MVDKNTFSTQFNNPGGGYFPTNNTQAIASSDLRAQALTLKESVFFLIDDAYSGPKGLAPGINTIAGLKTIATVSLTTGGLYVLFRDNGASNMLRVYELVTGTDTESSPDTIRPSDYAATTNEKVWKMAVMPAGSSSPPFTIWAWSAHANAAPTATAEGQAWMTTEVYVDGEFIIPAWSLLISKSSTSNSIDPDPDVSEFAIKL